MSSFVHLEYPTHHSGIDRIENAVAAAGQVRRSLNSAKGLAAMLLAAMVAALVVVADQLVDTWADGHLLAAWVVLWIVGFGALALLAGPARRVAQRVLTGLDGWSREVARRRADARLLEIAERDPRVMADLRAAMTRAEGAAESRPAVRQTSKERFARPSCYISYL